MKFVVITDSQKEFKGTKDCGNLLSDTALDKIDNMISFFGEKTGICIDQGGDDDTYELTAADPITEELAKELLQDMEEAF